MAHIVKWLVRQRFRLVLAGGVLIFAVLIWAGNIFMPTRLFVNDVYFVDAPVQDSIAIIAIDDVSLERYGRTTAEWERGIYAEFFERIREAQPRVIGVDLLFSGEEEGNDVLLSSLEALSENDVRTRLVLAGAGIERQATDATLLFRDNLALAQGFPDVADYIGYTNTVPDVDGRVRRQPTFFNFTSRETQTLSFSLSVYLAYLRIPAMAIEQVLTQEPNQLILPAEQVVQTDALGLWQQDFFGEPRAAFPTISFVDVMDGNLEADALRDKIVFVGVMDAISNLDQYAVPVSTTGELMAGVEIQAHAVETLLQGRSLQPQSNASELFTVIAAVLIATLALSVGRWYIKIGVALVLLAALFGIGSVTFNQTRTIFNLFDPALGIAGMLVITIGYDITRETILRQRTEVLLASVQHIAEQRLNMKNAIHYIEEDVRQIFPNAEAITVQIDPQIDLPASDQRRVVAPLVWQNVTQGAIIVETPRGSAAAQRAQLGRLATQLAPHLDNIQLYRDLQEQKLLVDTIYAEAPVGFALLNADDEITRYNGRFLELLAIAEDEVLVDFGALVAQQSDDAVALRQLREALIHDGEAQFNISIGEQSLNLAIALIPEYAVRVVIIADTTALAQLNKLKTQMLRMASHDLKNPLARIIGFTELLEMQSTDPKQERFLNHIMQSSEEMQHIIEDILDLERLRSGQVTFERFNFSQIVLQVYTSHQPDAIRKNQKMTYSPAGESIFVEGSVSQLSQAVTNLIGNAIKYTPDEGTVQVRLRQDVHDVLFEVEDTGYGIPEAAQAKMFTEFFRAKTSATAHIPGTGLGLSLVKSVIEQHGGTIGFVSEEGVGSTFWIRLPIMEVSDHA